VGELDDILILKDTRTVPITPVGAVYRAPFSLYGGGIQDHAAYWSFESDSDDATSIQVSSASNLFALTSHVTFGVRRGGWVSHATAVIVHV